MNYKERLWRWLIGINIIGLTWGTLAYGERFDGWSYPLSYIGRARTYPLELPNHKAQLIFATILIVNSLLILLIAGAYRRQRQYLLMLVAIVAAIGFAIAAISPDDTAHAHHVFGSALAIGFLWLLAGATVKSWRTQLLFQVPVIGYAVIYCWYDYSWYPATIQKIAVASLMYGLLRGSITPPDRAA